MYFVVKTHEKNGAASPSLFVKGFLYLRYKRNEVQQRNSNLYCKTVYIRYIREKKLCLPRQNYNEVTTLK